MSVSSRDRSRSPLDTPRTPFRTLIAAVEGKVDELKAEVESLKRTVDVLSGAVIASEEQVKCVLQRLMVDDDVLGEDVSGSLLIY